MTRTIRFLIASARLRRGLSIFEGACFGSLPYTVVFSPKAMNKRFVGFFVSLIVLLLVTLASQLL